MEEKLFELRPILGKDLSILVVVCILLTAIYSAIIIYFNAPKENVNILYIMLILDLPLAFFMGTFMRKQYKRLQNTTYNIYNDRIEIISCVNNLESRTISILDIKSVELRRISSKEVEKGSITIKTKTGNFYMLQQIPEPEVIYTMLQQKITT